MEYAESVVELLGASRVSKIDERLAAIRSFVACVPAQSSWIKHLPIPLSSTDPARAHEELADRLRQSGPNVPTLDIRWRSGGPAEETGFRRVNRQPSRGLGCRTWTAALSSLSCCIRGLDSNSPRCQSTASHLVRPDSTRGTMAATPEQARECTTSNSVFPPLVHRCTSGPLCACSGPWRNVCCG